jgi:hypothetical protein
VEAALASEDVYKDSSKSRLQDLLKEQTRLLREIETLESQWLAASERLELELAASE